MKLRSRDVLGLAFHDREVACALVDGRGRLRHAARFRADGDLSIAKPADFGRALRRFLDANGMTSSSAAIAGVPARWLMAEPREVPPADRATQYAGLRLAAERVSLGDDTKLLFDVAGQPSGKGGPALLVGLAGGRVEQVRHACDAAGLKLAGLTATGLAVAAAVPASGDRTVVLFDGDGAELVGDGTAGVRTFRHVGGMSRGPSSPALQRALALAGGGDVLLLDNSDVAACAKLSERVQRSVDCREPTQALRDVPALTSLNGHADSFARDRLWPAVVLADAGRQGAELPVDFLKPRLTPPKVSRLDRRYVLAGLAAVTVVGGIAALYKQVSDAEYVVAVRDEALRDRAPAIEAATEEIEQITFGKTFFENRPPALDCIADIARVMGREEPVWLSNLVFRDTGRAQIQGRAENQRAVLRLRDRLGDDAAFGDVQLADLREGAARGAGGAGGLTFSLTFTYQPPKPATPPAEASR